MSDSQRLYNRIDRRIWIWLKIRENLDREGFLFEDPSGDRLSD